VHLKYYTKKIFSYHDKLIALKEGLKISDIVLGLDADTVLNENHNFCFLNDINDINPGIYPHFLWKHPAHCSIENFLQGKNERVPYGILYKEFCVKNNLSTVNCSHMQESFILIKKNKTNENNIEKFFEIWEKLLYYLTLDSITENVEYEQYINGFSVSPKINNCIFKIWNSSFDNIKTDHLKKDLNFIKYDELFYLQHKND
jgi:hypothetical protein